MMILATTQQKEETRKNIDRLVKQNRPKFCKERVRRITDLDKILHRSVTKGTNKYFTTGHGVNERDFLAEGSPYTKNFEMRKMIPPKHYMLPTKNWKPKHGIRERLRVCTPTINEGVTDTIPDFYKTVACRPIKESFNKREYANQMRRRFLQNLQTGLYMDIIKRIDEHDDIARSILQKAVDDSEEAVWSLRVFLSEQINDIRSIETELKTVRNLKTKKEEKIDVALRKMGNLKVDMFKIMEKINETVKCREFLHNLGSDQWKYEYDIKKDKFAESKKSKVKEALETFEKYKKYLTGKDPGLEEIMSKFINLFQDAGPDEIPFKTSNDLALALKKIENENKDALVHIIEVEEPVTKVRGFLKEVDKCYENDLQFVKQEIERAEKELTEVKAKNDIMKIMLQDMITKYKRIIVSKNVLEERGLVKGLYDEIIENKRLNPTVLEMWEDIEENFMKLKQQLAFIPKDEAVRRKNIIKKKMKQEEKIAEKAKNRLRQIDQMVSSLRRAYEPPPKFGGKTLTPRSQPPKAPERTPTPEIPSRTFEYIEELKREHSMLTPLSIKYVIPRISPIPEDSPFRIDDSYIGEKEKIIKDYGRRQSLIPKPKSSQLPISKQERSKFVFASEDDINYQDLFGDRLKIEDPYIPVLNFPDTPKVTLPKYVPKVKEEKKNSDDEDSD